MSTNTSEIERGNFIHLKGEQFDYYSVLEESADGPRISGRKRICQDNY